LRPTIGEHVQDITRDGDRCARTAKREFITVRLKHTTRQGGRRIRNVAAVTGEGKRNGNKMLKAAMIGQTGRGLHRREDRGEKNLHSASRQRKFREHSIKCVIRVYFRRGNGRGKEGGSSFNPRTGKGGDSNNMIASLGSRNGCRIQSLPPLASLRWGVHR